MPAVPELTSSFAAGAAVPIPIRSFVASTERVLLSKLIPFVPHERTTARSLVTVIVLALIVIVSAAASPRVVVPFMITLSLNVLLPAND